MRKPSVKCNAFLNLIKTALGLLFPLISFPYVSRVLQVENLGKVNFGNSIVSYFSLLAAMGIAVYAVREGAKLRDAPKKFQQFANEVFTLNLITTAVAYVLLGLAVAVFAKLRGYAVIILIQSLSMILATLGIEWMNSVFEDYLYITVRSILVQLLTLVCLFVLVRSEQDYLLYAGLTVMSNGAICVSNLIYCRRYCKVKVVMPRNARQHLKPMAIFFSNALAVTIYVSSDMTILGWIAGDWYVGLYTVPVKIYQMAKQMLTAIYTVYIPRLSQSAQKDDKTEFRSLLDEITGALLLLILPLCVGMMFFAENIVMIISGMAYIEGAWSLRILSLALLFAVGSGVLVNCVNTPLSREKISLRATLISALTNILLNFIAIPLFHHNGAAVTTVIAEMLVFIYCLVKLPRRGDYWKASAVWKQTRCGLYGAGIVAVVSLLTKWLLPGQVWPLVCAVAVSVTLYLALLVVTKNEYVNQYVQKAKSIIKSKTV